MAFMPALVCRSCLHFQNTLQIGSRSFFGFVKPTYGFKNARLLSSGHLLLYHQNVYATNRPGAQQVRSFASSPNHSSQNETAKNQVSKDAGKAAESDKPPADSPPRGIRQRISYLWVRFKEMYRDYWYILIPVHAVTSVMWFGGFFFLAKGGFDIIPLLDSVGTPAWLVDPIRNSNAGYFAVAYALYKVVTPIRYATTLGGTTYAINYLKVRGKIKPVPSRKEIHNMVQDKTVKFNEKRLEIQADIEKRSREIRSRGQHFQADVEKRARGLQANWKRFREQ